MRPRARVLSAFQDVQAVPAQICARRQVAGRHQGELVKESIMSQTDPIAELLTRIRNAMRARYNELTLPHSRLREAICRVLMAEGFLAGVEVGGEAPKKMLALKLRLLALCIGQLILKEFQVALIAVNAGAGVQIGVDQLGDDIARQFRI